MPATSDLALHLYLQLVIILAACHIVGYLLRYLGQTQVVGEMVAGILLGPSLLGLMWPQAQTWLFPKSLVLVSGATSITVPHPSMLLLYTLGQLGLVLYMFMVGLEFNTSLVSKHIRHAGAISLSGVITPIILGGALGYILGGSTSLFGDTIRAWQAAIFLAAAMSVTAFPVLARIITDLKLARSRIGTIALGAAATNDAIAWCLLAIVLATASGSPAIAAFAIGGGLLYALLMFFVAKRLLLYFDRVTTYRNGLPFTALVAILGILLLCAAFTDGVGIHSIFGAFVLGAVMPRGQVSEEVRRSVERLATAIFVPIFFVYSGLNTHFDLLGSPSLLGTTIVIIVVAFLAKGVACFLAGRFNGSSIRGAASLGVLMNARGLMELVLINVGLDRGIISPALFTILVLMTVVTTMIAAPLFRALYPRDEESSPAAVMAAGTVQT
jgi:Kef-type K+ transport system membrane component KefB